MDPGICNFDRRTVFFPVRHHSPTGARLVCDLIHDLRPAAVLIEGPSDFNERLDELFLPHRLPLSIYSYVRLADGRRRGAFYPFCVYSPEWQALQAAREIGARAAFIDLPWVMMADQERAGHRYADGELRRSAYVPTLCRRLGVEDFDALWDTLFEVDPTLTLRAYFERMHHFCYHSRVLDRAVRTLDRRREAFMTERVREEVRVGGPVLVVTGGYHSYALFAALHDLPFEEDAEVEASPGAPDAGEGEADPGASEMHGEPPERGIALTPFSYARLDGLTGYDSGMPSPGFYHHAWEVRRAVLGTGPSTDQVAEPARSMAAPQPVHRGLLALAAAGLRERRQTASTADLIAIEAAACGLAALRGHAEVWRRDLVDAITTALVKDELEYGAGHPFLDAIQTVFRGGERGQLAAGTTLPPLALDVQRLLAAHDLVPDSRERSIDLDLSVPGDLARSRVLHRLRVLGVRGFDRTGGTDFAARQDLARVWEKWRLRWTPDLDATCIEAAVYGPSLADAAAAHLHEQVDAVERSAEQAALLLLEAALMGLSDPAEPIAPGAPTRPVDRAEPPQRAAPATERAAALHARLVALIREDGSFASVAGALGHLLYLYRYDEFLGTSGAAEVGALLVEAYERARWLLQLLGPGEAGPAVLRGVRTLLDTFQGCAAALGLDRASFGETLARVGADDARPPALRGACAGALWTLGEAGVDALLAGLRASADPDRLGDYLTGLFSLAREAAQRDPALVLGVDDALMEYDDEGFLAALPALRLAFSYFTPREKHYLAATLLASRGAAGAAPLPALEVPAEVAARALALEARLLAQLARYGIRGAEAAR